MSSITPDPEHRPLLPSDRARLPNGASAGDLIDCHINKFHGSNSNIHTLRTRLQTFLVSKWGHYFVITLVSLDIACIFADFLIKLHICEHTCSTNSEKGTGFDAAPWERTVEVLDIMSLLFSSLFMLELLGSFFAFGPSYFHSRFHVFDAVVIVVAFIIDVLLRGGTLEEAGSLIVVLRLWRVFKIVEEFSSGAQEELEGVQEVLEGKEREVEGLRKEVEGLRRRLEGNGNGRVH